MPVQAELPKGQYRSVIRLVKRANLGRAMVLKTATHNALKRLGVKRDPSKAVPGMPRGSDQGNIRSIIVWMDNVGPGDVKAVRQIVAVDATCVARTS